MSSISLGVKLCTLVWSVTLLFSNLFDFLFSTLMSFVDEYYYADNQ